MVLIDTSVLIEYFRKQDKTKTFLYELAGKHSDIYASTITKFEIWVGNRPHQSVFWQNLFSSLKTLPFGDLEAEEAGNIQQTLLKTGQQIGILRWFGFAGSVRIHKVDSRCTKAKMHPGSNATAQMRRMRKIPIG
jgi:predicted nucleic acid-binding protein